jgi:dTDP-4-dehydrorhamnose reductase
MHSATLILGADGQLGGALARALPAATAWTADDFDLCRPAELLLRLRGRQPRLVINCAALTDVDACERDAVRALQANALGVQSLAQWQQESGATVVQVSTDYLFDGRQATPYREDDAPRPLQVYGVSKWLSERWLDPARSLIVRTSTLLGTGRASFVGRVRAWAAGRSELRVVADLVAAPTTVPDLAQALQELLVQQVRGTVNVTNAGACSRADLARTMLAGLGLTATVHDARQAEFAAPARRPVYSELALDRLRDYGITMRPWRAALDDLLRQQRKGGT